MALSEEQIKYIDILSITHNIDKECTKHNLSRNSHYFWLKTVSEYKDKYETAKFKAENNPQLIESYSLRLFRKVLQDLEKRVDGGKEKTKDLIEIAKMIITSKYSEANKKEQMATEIIKKLEGKDNVKEFRKAI